MTIEQLLEEKELHLQNETVYNEKVLNLAKKFSFVTPVSSLVVVKPNGNNIVVDPKPAINGKHKKCSRKLYEVCKHDST